MKKTLLFALVVVSTLTCIAPAAAKVPENQNYANSRNAALIEKPENNSDGAISSKSTNQPTISNKKQTTEASLPKRRGKPGNPTAAGRR